jgi:dUTP pyrophosphatase
MITMRTVKLKRLDEKAIVPEYQTKGSAGFDMCSIIDFDLEPGMMKIIPTGWSIEIPEDTELQLRSRSSVAKNYKVTLMNSVGTLDSDYRGPIGFLLNNFGYETFKIRVGDRIGQAILAPVYQAVFNVVEELTETIRGAGGYGSTGK